MKAAVLLLMELLCRLLVYAQPAVPYGRNPAAGHYQLVRGVWLHYETYGQRPPLLLLHGNGDNLNGMSTKGTSCFDKRMPDEA